jgi:POT family proton-dependent oligopeptide transporter
MSGPTAPDPALPGGTGTLPTEHTLFGQPRQLWTMFSIESWERFSFYGMQGILLIYLYYSVAEGGLGIDQGVAAGVVGAYGGAVYLSTIVGAWLADRVIGAERTLFWSAVLVMIGHIALSVLPGLTGVAVGLVCVATGSGGVKANATSLVGILYGTDDSRRDAGFSIYYLGINLGALAGSLLTGWLQSDHGFHWGFAAAAVGMAVGLVVYSFGRRNLPPKAHEIPHPLPAGRLRTTLLIGAVVAALAVVLVATGVIPMGRLDDAVTIVIIVAAVFLFAIILRSPLSAVERRRMLAFIPLFIVNAAFWSLYQQQFTVLTIYSDQQLDRDLFGWDFPVSWVQSINPVFIILLSPVFAILWTKLGDRQPTTPHKFAAGTLLMGVAFLLFLTMASSVPNSAPLLGVTGIILVFTLAELTISPTGMAVTTRLAPTAFRTQTVALYFLSIALGTSMSGVLAGYYSVEDQVSYWTLTGGAAVVVGLLTFVFAKPIGRLMSGVR